MRCLLLILHLFVSGCTNKLVTLGSTGLGAGTGGLVGGPGGAAIGGMLGYSGAELMDLSKNQDSIQDQMTEAVVKTIVDTKMKGHVSATDQFKETIKKLLIIVGVILLIYLCIPIFVARYTAQRCTEQHLTRPPFPNK